MFMMTWTWSGRTTRLSPTPPRLLSSIFEID
jgi:hypothetical protein